MLQILYSGEFDLLNELWLLLNRFILALNMRPRHCVACINHCVSIIIGKFTLMHMNNGCLHFLCCMYTSKNRGELCLCSLKSHLGKESISFLSCASHGGVTTSTLARMQANASDAQRERSDVSNGGRDSCACCQPTRLFHSRHLQGQTIPPQQRCVKELTEQHRPNHMPLFILTFNLCLHLVMHETFRC